MQIRVQAGGQTWMVDESSLVNWLYSNGSQVGTPRVEVREVIDPRTQGSHTNDNLARVLLNESVD